MLRDLKPTDNVGGFDVRPGNFLLNGATTVSGGVNFTIHSVNRNRLHLSVGFKSLNIIFNPPKLLSKKQKFSQTQHMSILSYYVIYSTHYLQKYSQILSSRLKSSIFTQKKTGIKNIFGLFNHLLTLIVNL